ncbi:MAG: NAD kinase [Actinomycetes bacterium]
MTDTREPLAEVRRVFIVPHFFRDDAREITRGAVRGLLQAGIEVHMLAEDAERVGLADVVGVDPSDAVTDCELVMVFGGDGTILRAAELARGKNVPLFGVNFGHIGFLAEAEPEDLPSVLAAVITRSYVVEERSTVQVEVFWPTGERITGWALNDVCLEKAARERMIEVVLAVDDKPVSQWGCDGVVCATPTGSTAYAWSGGGPVVWPDVDALLIVPISAHSLFSKPLVIGPKSEIDIEVMAQSDAAVIWCDGRRLIEAPPRSRVEIRQSSEPVKLARVHAAPFSGRLVRKFALPVSGWRGRDSDPELDESAS